MTMIEVATIEPAKPGKKMGKLMTTGGEPYLVWPSDLSKFTPQGRYEIEFEENEFQGRTYRKVKKVQPIREPAPVPAQAGKAGGNGHIPAAKPTADGEREFIRDLLMVGIRTGAVAFSIHDLRTAVTMLQTLWRELK